MIGNLWNREPVLILAVLQTALALLLAFGVHLSVAQIGAIMAFSSAVLGLITRSQVTSAATLQTMTPTTLKLAQDAAAPSLGSVSIKSVLLACSLGGSLLVAGFSSIACSSLRHVATVADATALSTTEAADDLEFAAYRGGSVLVGAHKAFSVELSKVYHAEIEIAKLIKAVPVGGTLDLAQALPLLAQLKTAAAAAIATLPASLSGPISAKLNQAIALAGKPLGQ